MRIGSLASLRDLADFLAGLELLAVTRAMRICARREKRRKEAAQASAMAPVSTDFH